MVFPRCAKIFIKLSFVQVEQHKGVCEESKRMPVFSDDQFIDSLKELETPEVGEFELFFELPGIKVYRKFLEVPILLMKFIYNI